LLLRGADDERIRILPEAVVDALVVDQSQTRMPRERTREEPQCARLARSRRPDESEGAFHSAREQRRDDFLEEHGLAAPRASIENARTNEACEAVDGHEGAPAKTASTVQSRASRISGVTHSRLARQSDRDVRARVRLYLDELFLGQQVPVRRAQPAH